MGYHFINFAHTHFIFHFNFFLILSLLLFFYEQQQCPALCPPYSSHIIILFYYYLLLCVLLLLLLLLFVVLFVPLPFSSRLYLTKLSVIARSMHVDDDNSTQTNLRRINEFSQHDIDRKFINPEEVDTLVQTTDPRIHDNGNEEGSEPSQPIPPFCFDPRFFRTAARNDKCRDSNFYLSLLST